MTDGTIRVGPLEVRADSEALAAYRAATSGGPVADVPLAFTLRWMTAPAVRTALAGLLVPGEVMIHEAQKFTAHRPLRPDTPYRMTITCRRTADPDRLTAAADVCDGDGAAVLDIETVLRLLTPASPA